MNNFQYLYLVHIEAVDISGSEFKMIASVRIIIDSRNGQYDIFTRRDYTASARSIMSQIDIIR